MSQYNEMRLTALLLAVYSMSITTVFGQITAPFKNNNPAFCCNYNPGPRVTPEDVYFEEIINESPNYGQVVTRSLYTQGLDNVCYTYFRMSRSSALMFTGFTYCDKSYIISKYIVSELSGNRGVARAQGLFQDRGSSSLVFDDVYLGHACPDLRVYYRNYIAGRCDILMNSTQYQVVDIHADSSTREISDYCKSQVAAVINSQQLGCNNLQVLPNRLNRCCVTQFNGVSCVNADWVLPQDSVSLPDTEPRCKMYNLY